MGNTSGRKTQKPRPGLVAPCALGYTESKGRLVKSPTLELGTNAKQEARSWTNLVKDNFAKENSTSTICRFGVKISGRESLPASPRVQALPR